eukprot:scaffold8138_cov188-Skeletonema_menzelii.AAC.1
MVSIEYSPNARARCQACRDKIAKGDIRVCAKSGAPVSRNGGYTNQYHHAECYTNRKDFTSLWGFYKLDKEDQKKFMTEEQKRKHFPPPPPGEDVKRNANAADCTDQNTVAKKQKKSGDVFSITGLKYAEASATTGDKVTLRREPENMYDANAVKVLNGYGQLIGRIDKSKAAILSPKMKKLEEECHKQQLKMVVEGTIASAGDGYQQLVEVVFKKIPMKTIASTAKPSAKSATARIIPNPYAKSATASKSNDC